MGDVLGDSQFAARQDRRHDAARRSAGDRADGAAGEMFGYSTRLRSMSQGRAVYSMEFSHYEEVPKSKAEEIINKVEGVSLHPLHSLTQDTRNEPWARQSSSGTSRT